MSISNFANSWIFLNFEKVRKMMKAFEIAKKKQYNERKKK
ncbi:hypothetical protein SGODD07_00072 [Streptococcus gordonii]|uniref:Uncharacterized protein n=1 Tax=Streptococcus gordonii TaxID=1302 RepID=A0A139NGF6_STRGN|nr:hypothetical protein SGODD07_00072 [Streptococcus gordonii]